MSIERILEQLKKEKDPLKYLENELDKARKAGDKKLKNSIAELIEKEKSKNKNAEEKKAKEEQSKIKIPSLEQIAMSIPRPGLPRVPTERLENYQSRTRARIMTPGLPQQEKTGRQQQGYSEDYGSNIRSDYIGTKADFQKSLEASGLTSRAGFTATAESKHAIQQKAGDRGEYIEARNNLNIQEYNVREIMVKENLVGLHPDLKQAKRGRKEIEVYHG
ncbi:hypothetical protein J4443_04310 [Candidatus Woesearchaeota archaeon]|nr:hypothetical protein [Candidatus Woesearchaeota archaeon]